MSTREKPPEPGGYELVEVVADGYLPFAPQWGQSPVQFVARAGNGTIEYRGGTEPPAVAPPPRDLVARLEAAFR